MNRLEAEWLVRPVRPTMVDSRMAAVHSGTATSRRIPVVDGVDLKAAGIPVVARKAALRIRVAVGAVTIRTAEALRRLLDDRATTRRADIVRAADTVNRNRCASIRRLCGSGRKGITAAIRFHEATAAEALLRVLRGAAIQRLVPRRGEADLRRPGRRVVEGARRRVPPVEAVAEVTTAEEAAEDATRSL